MSPMILLFLTLPLIAVGLVILMSRWEPAHGFVPAVLGCGVAGAILAGLFAFTQAATPIAPYETGPGAWLPVVWGVLEFAYIGFGLALLLAIPAALVVAVIRSQRSKHASR